MWRIVKVAALFSAVVLVIAGLTVSSDAAEQTAATCGGEQPAADPLGGTYSCTFSDDFAGSAYDTSKWLAQSTALSGMPTGSAGCYVDSPSTVGVSDGAAHVAAHKVAPFTCASPYGSYTSQQTVGTLTTHTKFSQTYGRFEFRARMPQAGGLAGVHTALWLMPESNTYGKWPNSGEVDVAEWYSVTPSKIYPSVHYTGEPAPQSTGWNCSMSSPTAYHTYAVDWTPSMMYFYVDDKLCWQHTWLEQSPLPGSQPFDQPFYPVLTTLYDNTTGTNPLTATTPASASMDVDWVRVFRREEPAAPTSTGRSTGTSAGTSAGATATATKKRTPSLGRALVRVNRARR